MLKIKNNDYAFFKGIECRFWQVEENLYRLQTSFKEGLLSIGFKRYENCKTNEFLSDKVFITLSAEQIQSAFQRENYCNYQDGKYYLENIILKKNDIILSPELETKKKLGLHFYDDRRIHLPYQLFVNEVTDIWEERKPIEGFKFDVDPIVYLKKDGVWLIEH